MPSQSEETWSSVEGHGTLFGSYEIRNAFELRVREINEDSVLFEIRVGNARPEKIVMTVKDNFLAHLTMP